MDGKDSTEKNLLFEKVTVGDHTIIGENHRRETYLDYTYSDEVFQQLLEENSDSLFVLEADHRKPSAWLESEVENGFMTQAGKFAFEKDLPYVIMDDGRMSGYDVWEFACTDINQQDFAFTRALMRSILDFRKGIPLEKTIEALGILNDLQDPFRTSKLEGVRLFSVITNGHFSQESIDDLVALIGMSINYDAVCREILYQAKVQRVTEMYPKKTLFMVFGGNHVPGIQKTLEDETHKYRTPLLPSDEIKRRIAVYRTFLASYS